MGKKAKNRHLDKEVAIYDEAYDYGTSLWNNVEHKKIHHIAGDDIGIKLNKLRDEYAKGVILNLGSGTGENICSLLNKATKVISTDVSKKAIQKAKEKWRGGNTNFLVSDVHKLCFKEEYFDYIEGISILHHVEYKLVLPQIRAILKKNGVAIFWEPGLLNPPAAIARRYFPTPYHTDDEMPFIPAKLVKECKSYFSKVEIFSFNIFSYGISYYLPDNIITQTLVKLLRTCERIFEQNLLRQLTGHFLIVLHK